MGRFEVVTDRQLAGLKAALFLLALVPAGRLAWAAWQGTLGANPIEAVTRALGDWTLNFVVLTLCVTPLRKATGWVWLTRLRRMLGLFAFFYAALHVTSYVWFDQFFDWGEIARDILKRPFITAGFAAFAIMALLAATSSNAMVRRLGGRRWRDLHRSIYALAPIAVVHYAWMVKKDITLPAAYGAAIAFLLGLRAWWRWQERQRQLAGAYLKKPRGKVIPIAVKR